MVHNSIPVIFVYILELSDSTYYTGMTIDLMRRLSEHDHGRCISTKKKVPILKVWFFECRTRLTARKLEEKIKSIGAEKMINKIKFDKNGPHTIFRSR